MCRIQISNILLILKMFVVYYDILFGRAVPNIKWKLVLNVPVRIYFLLCWQFQRPGAKFCLNLKVEQLFHSWSSEVLDWVGLHFYILEVENPNL